MDYVPRLPAVAAGGTEEANVSFQFVLHRVNLAQTTGIFT